MNRKLDITISLTILLLSVVFGALSFYVMSGYQDCQLDEPFFHHTLPAEPLPSNCASQLRLLMQTLLGYFAAGLLLCSFLLLPYLEWKRNKLNDTEIDSIKISE